MSAESSRSRPLAGRLSVGALGVGLTLLVAAAWATGAWYLVARLGAGSPIGLALMDGVHIYAGLVGGVFVLAKVLRVGLRSRVRGVPGVLLWHRWLSWSLLFLYAAILLSGTLLLLPIRGRLYGDLTEIHLLTSVWALVPTTWHVWHYRSRAVPFLRRMGLSGRRRRFWIGLALLAPAAIALLLQPRAASQLSAVMGGQSWSRNALTGAPLNAIATTPDGSTLLAGGDALYFTRDGILWAGLGLPSPAPIIESLAAAPDGGVYAGTTGGLYFARTLQGPLAPIALDGANVGAVAVDPGDPRSVGVASSLGPLFSHDAGRTWSIATAGLLRPQRASAIAYFGGKVFVSDTTGVFALSDGATTWTRVSRQASVVALTVSAARDRLYATSTTQGIQMLAGGRWSPLAAPGPSHQHHGQMQMHAFVGGVLGFGSRLYVPGTQDGVSASADGGQTWTQLGGGVADTPTLQLVEFQGSLWAATESGAFRYRLTPGARPSPLWWTLLVIAALGGGMLACAVAVTDRSTRRPPG